MPACECSSSSSGTGQSCSTASRNRCSEPTPGFPPHENTIFAGAPHPDQLVVDDVGGHPDERQVAPSLPDQLVPGRMRDQVREAFERDDVAVVDELGHRVGELGDRGHIATGRYGADCPLVNTPSQVLEHQGAAGRTGDHGEAARPLPVAGAGARDPLVIHIRPATARGQRVGPRGGIEPQHDPSLHRHSRRSRLPPAGRADQEVPARPARGRPRLLGDQLDGAAGDLGATPAAAERRDRPHREHGDPRRRRHRLHRALPQLAARPARDRSQPARRLAPARLLHLAGQGDARVPARRGTGAAVDRVQFSRLGPNTRTSRPALLKDLERVRAPASPSTTRSSPTACARSRSRCGAPPARSPLRSISPCTGPWSRSTT